MKVVCFSSVSLLEIDRKGGCRYSDPASPFRSTSKRETKEI
jgi:hypothetical protein